MRTPPRSTSASPVDPECKYLAEHVLEQEAYAGPRDDQRARVLRLADYIQRAIASWLQENPAP